MKSRALASSQSRTSRADVCGSSGNNSGLAEAANLKGREMGMATGLNVASGFCGPGVSTGGAPGLLVARPMRRSKEEAGVCLSCSRGAAIGGRALIEAEKLELRECSGRVS